jgi:hypothetical protein
MRDDGVSVESLIANRGSSFPLANADFFAADWWDTPPAGVIPKRPEKAKGVSVVMLLLGVALLWAVPLGGALLLATAALGLTLLCEAQPGGPSTAPPAADPVLHRPLKMDRPLPRWLPVCHQWLFRRRDISRSTATSSEPSGCPNPPSP